MMKIPTRRQVAFAATLLLCANALAAPPVIEGKDGWLFAGWESGDKVDDATLAANIRLLQDAQAALAARGVALLVLVVPAKAPLYPDRLPAAATTPQVAARYASVLAQLGKAGVATLDDRAVLQAVEGAPVQDGGQGDKTQTAFYRADYHWTAWSAEASAAAVAAVINSRWPLPPSSSPGATLGAWTRDRHFGDLADNFLSPEERKRIGRDSYTVRAAADGAALLDSAPPHVIVVGNSFVQPYLGFPQKLSNALGQPVGLTWNPGNISPWKTLLDAVASPGFAAHTPKVLVWQLNEARMDTSLDSTAAWDAGSAMPASVWRGKLHAALAR
jgi:alginate O-acetyltransferase complex protein AlgJ